MDPVTLVVAALLAGAEPAGKDLVVRAVEQAENNPDPEEWEKILKEEQAFTKAHEGRDLPAEFIPLAFQGKKQFEKGNYGEAEKAYRGILEKLPRSLYALSNLGVILLRSGKHEAAEEMLNKAIEVAPGDVFSHCTLGIAYYQESKLDEAIDEMKKALKIDPKNATAHNYLGISASQKGWVEIARTELEAAVECDPSYGDAYFNLAVVIATQQPQDKVEAQKYYTKALELGAQADPALEQLIK